MTGITNQNLKVRRSLRRITVGLVVSGLVAAACVSDGADESALVDDHADPESHQGEPTSDTDAAAVGGEPAGSPLSDTEVTIAVANSVGTLLTGTPQRLMTALVDPSGAGYLGSSTDPVEVVVLPVQADSAEGEQRLTAEWLSAHEADLGLYLSRPVFDAPGTWEIRIESAGVDIGGTIVEVFGEPLMPAVGTAAPLTDTPTSAGRDDLTAISTDPEPNPTFYESTIADAVSSGRPTVIAFATPAFCQTALCGPTMALVKGAVIGRTDLNVVHVEPYDLDAARSGSLVPVDAMVDWKLPTEPWVFVVDDTGTVTAAFEGIFSADELEAALDGL